MHYCIGDLHGQLPALKLLLDRINYNPGKDDLYFLGDYTDWGTDSMGTLQYIMELEQNSDHVTALLGNHDLMMRNTINSREETIRTLYEHSQWKRNRGDETLRSYLKLPEEQRTQIQKWLQERPVDLTLNMGTTTYILCHGMPLCVAQHEAEEQGGPFDCHGQTTRAVWYRPTPYEDFSDKIHGLTNWRIVRGHSITDSGRVENWDNGIINIDCGAKVFAVDLEHTDMSEQEKNECRNSALAAFCLEDQTAVYVTYYDFQKLTGSAGGL